MIRIVFAIFFTFLLSGISYANDFQSIVGGPQVLSIDYGINKFKVKDHDVMIVRGRILRGNAWDQDNYYSMISVRHKWDFIETDYGESVIRSIPHTGEDRISGVCFLSSDKLRINDLYLLQATREYIESPEDIVKAKFILYKLEKDDIDNSHYIFTNIGSFESSNKYRDSSEAMLHEFGLRC